MRADKPSVILKSLVDTHCEGKYSLLINIYKEQRPLGHRLHTCRRYLACTYATYGRNMIFRILSCLWFAYNRTPPPPPPPAATFLRFIPARGGGAGMLAGGIEKGRGGGVFWGISESLDTAKMKTQMLEQDVDFFTY